MLCAVFVAASAVIPGSHHTLHVPRHAEAELAAATSELASTKAELASVKAQLATLRALANATASNKPSIHDIIPTHHYLPMIAGTLRLGLFEYLKYNVTNTTFDELYVALNVSSKGLDALLNGLVAAGFVDYDQQSDTLALGEELMHKDLASFKTTVMGYAVSTQRQFYYIADSVREGRAVGLTQVLGDYPSLYEARSNISEVATYWDPWMQQQDSQGRFDRILTTLYSTDAVRNRSSGGASGAASSRSGTSTTPGRFNGRLLDWCGNTGGNAIMMAQRDPTLNVTVLDLPTQVAKAAPAIADAGLSSQIGTLGVDLLDDSFAIAGSYDAVTMIHTIREWSKEHLARFFRLIYAALTPGGGLIMDMVAKHAEGTGYQLEKKPQQGLNSLYFLVSASHEQHSHTPKELVDMLKNAGFSWAGSADAMCVEGGVSGGYVMATK